MILKEISFPTPQENILFDETLFYLADKKEGPEVLRFWESDVPFVVLGRIGKIHDDVELDAVHTDNIPVLRRCSGGGTVIQGKGSLNFTFVVRKERDSQMHDLRKSYQYLLGFVQNALDRQGIESVFQPISDLALKGDDKKFSGNAQRRGRNVVLHHGTILYDFKLELIEKYLKVPKDQPEYRRDRSHLDFITNISCDAQRFKTDLAQLMSANEADEDVSKDELDQLSIFLKQKDVTLSTS